MKRRQRLFAILAAILLTCLLGYIWSSNSSSLPSSVHLQPPLIIDEVAYVPSDQGVVAVDLKTGKMKWKLNGKRVSFLGHASQMLVSDELLLFGGDDKSFHAVDIKNGEERWQITVDSELSLWSGPVVKDSTVFFGSTDHHLYAVDIPSGEVRWTFMATEYVRSPVLFRHLVVFGTNDGNLYAVDSDTGDLKWKGSSQPPWSNAFYAGAENIYSADEKRIWSISMATGTKRVFAPVDKDAVLCMSQIELGLVFMRMPKGESYAMDVDTGRVLWRFEEQFHGRDIEPYFDGQMTYFSHLPDNRPADPMKNTIYAVNSQSGKIIWKYPIDGLHRLSWPNDPAMDDDVICFANPSSWAYHPSNSNIFALDKRTGQEKWRFKLARWQHQKPTLEGDTVYFASGSFLLGVDKHSGQVEFSFDMRAGKTGAYQEEASTLPRSTTVINPNPRGK